MYLDGMFSFVLYDKRKDRIIAARDPIGVTTLYQGWSSEQPHTTYFASEMKCLSPICDRIIAFPPGHVFDSNTGTAVSYFNPKWYVLNLNSLSQQESSCQISATHL